MDYADDIQELKTRLGRRVCEYRTLRGLTQKELAAATGTGATYISEVENGKRNPTISRIAAIAAALQVDAMELCRP